MHFSNAVREMAPDQIDRCPFDQVPGSPKYLGKVREICNQDEWELVNWWAFPTAVETLS